MTATIAKDREERVSTPVFRDEGVVHPTRRVAVLDGLKDAQSIVGEEFRLLRARVQTICEQRAINCLAVVSALPGEGKSTVALGLANACAREAGRRILLVETDLRRPTISRDLGLPSFPGVGEYLNGETEHVPLRRVEPGGFFLLSSGEAELESPEILGSPRMEAFLRAARATFDLVILDAPPVLPVADVVLMQDLLDGFLLVVRSRMTPRAALHDALRRIRSEKVVGVILNDHREYRGSYMTHAYKGYGMSESRRSWSRGGSR